MFSTHVELDRAVSSQFVVIFDTPVVAVPRDTLNVDWCEMALTNALQLVTT